MMSIISSLKRNNLLCSIFFTTLIVVGCEKEELPIEPHATGDVTENQVEMGSDYRNQLFYDIETNTVVSSNEKTLWDIAFESAPNGKHIILNTAKGMAVHHSELSYAELLSEDDMEWQYDAHSGNIDSTAFDTIIFNQLYLVDRGYDWAGTHLGFTKIYITDSDASTYSIAFGDISSTSPNTAVIEKRNDNLFTYFSFDTGAEIVAPANEEFDLIFTQYTYLFTDPITPYIVSGIILNRYNTKAIEWQGEESFESIDYDDIAGINFTDDIEIIGYDWKWYDFDQGLYVVDPNQTFIIQTAEGYFYKFHFIDFYNESGIKGYPKFEFVQL